MSDRDTARHALAEVYFAGVDISKSLRPYLLSLSYTDNEEDETDDLQIKIEDRDGTWLRKWLDVSVHDAIEGGGASSASSGSGYTVTAKSGLNIRSGPGTSYSKYGAFAYGAAVSVQEISGGWAKISYNGKTAYVAAEYLKAEGGGNSGSDGAGAAVDKVKGLSIQAAILRCNWNGDGKDTMLNCGQFELDSVQASGPPNTIAIKATSLPYSSTIRQMKKSKAWEGYYLSGIAGEMAGAAGMAVIYESGNDPYYDRVEQITQTDITFLQTLCHNAGLSLKVANNILVLFDQADYEKKDTVFTIAYGSTGYTKWRLNTGEAEVKYTSCRVSYTKPSGEVVQGTAYVEDYKSNDDNNQCLEITAAVANAGEAKALAEKKLREHNKFELTAAFTLPGNPTLTAGRTVMLRGWGMWNGKYMIKQAKHTVDGSGGYTTQISLRRVLEGY